MFKSNFKLILGENKSKNKNYGIYILLEIVEVKFWVILDLVKKLKEKGLEKFGNERFDEMKDFDKNGYWDECS
jgi:hypothetical protein